MNKTNLFQIHEFMHKHEHNQYIFTIANNSDYNWCFRIMRCQCGDINGIYHDNRGFRILDANHGAAYRRVVYDNLKPIHQKEMESFGFKLRTDSTETWIVTAFDRRYNNEHYKPLPNTRVPKAARAGTHR